MLSFASYSYSSSSSSSSYSLLFLLLLLLRAESWESMPFPYLHSSVLFFYVFFLSFVLSIFGTAILSSVILLSTKYNWDVWTLNTHYNRKWNIAHASTQREREEEKENGKKILEKITLNHMFLYFGNSERISFGFFLHCCSHPFRKITVSHLVYFACMHTRSFAIHSIYCLNVHAECAEWVCVCVWVQCTHNMYTRLMYFNEQIN